MHMRSAQYLEAGVALHYTSAMVSKKSQRFFQHVLNVGLLAVGLVALLTTTSKLGYTLHLFPGGTAHADAPAGGTGTGTGTNYTFASTNDGGPPDSGPGPGPGPSSSGPA